MCFYCVAYRCRFPLWTAQFHLLLWVLKWKWCLVIRSTRMNLLSIHCAPHKKAKLKPNVHCLHYVKFHQFLIRYRPLLLCVRVNLFVVVVANRFGNVIKSQRPRRFVGNWLYPLSYDHSYICFCHILKRVDKRKKINSQIHLLFSYFPLSLSLSLCPGWIYKKTHKKWTKDKNAHQHMNQM